MQKNFVLFMVTCLVIIMGWLYIQNKVWPPRRPDPNKLAKKDDEKKPPTPKPVLGVNVAVNRLVARHPLVETVQLALDLERAKELFPPQVAEVKPAPKQEVKQEVKPGAALPIEKYTIGNDKTHLQAVLTTKGAGVEKLVLNRFEAADYLGLPMDGQRLELIQEDPFRPSFLMYHYAAAKDERPLQTLGDAIWKFEERRDGPSGEEVTFSTRLPGQEHIKITKTYRLGPKDYHLTLLLEFEHAGRAADGVHTLRYQLAGAHGQPVEGEWYTSVFRNAMIGMRDSHDIFTRDLQDSYQISLKLGGDRVPAGDRQGGMLQYAVVATQYFASGIVVDNEQPDKRDGGVDRRGILAWARPTHESSERRGRISRLDDDLLVLTETETVGRPYYLLPHVKRHIDAAKLKLNDKVVVSYYETSDGRRVATWIRRGQTARPFLDDITVRVVSEPIQLHPGDKVAHQLMLYNGPIKARLLGQFSGERAVPENLVERYAQTLHLDTLTDYGTVGFFRWIGWSALLVWTTKLMHFLLHWLSFAGYGISIILLTVVVRGLMFPISKKQALFSIKMQALGPELKKLNEKYKNDPQGKTQATMELYRKHGVHPLGGCLPIFLQMPIFLGLYYALQESIHFRLASFLWIENLAAPDMLLWWSESIPWISDPDSQGGVLYLGPYFNVLPILAVTFMFFQQKLLMPPPTSDEQAMQQKVMQYMMIFMGVLFYKVAAGLCIYFIASTLWGLAERKLLPKKLADSPPTAAKGPPAKGRPKGDAKSNGNGAVDKVKNWWAKLLEDAKKK